MARKSRGRAAPPVAPSSATEPSAPLADPSVDPSGRPATPESRPQTFSRTPPRTVAGSTWVVICVAVLILIAVIIFVSQNTSSVRVTFLFLHGRFPLAVALLGAVAAGCVLTLVIGSTRILQLRRIVRKRQREDIAAAQAAAVTDGPATEGAVTEGAATQPEVAGRPAPPEPPDVSAVPGSGEDGIEHPIQ